ncbi:hypothetical protein KI387_032992, partial [Taxus chinensis]
SSSTAPNTLAISTHTNAIISPTMSAAISTTAPLLEGPLAPTSSAPPTNILDTTTQYDNANTNDSDDEVDTVEIVDDKLGTLNFTPIEVDDSYFNDTFVVVGL